MSKIPEDAMRAAREAVASFYDKEGETDYASKVRNGYMDNWWWMRTGAIAILAERERSRTALSEAEQRVQDARRVAMNAEHYGYLHGLEAAAKIAETGTFHGVFQTQGDRRRAENIASRIRALIPSEPHDAEGRKTPRRGDPTIFDDAEGRN